MKILVIGDVHHKITKFQLGCQFLRWLETTIRDRRPDCVVHLGDHFDGHSVLRSEVLAEFKHLVDAVTALNIRFYYIIGNHDQFRPNDSRYHALQALKDTNPLFVVIDSPFHIPECKLSFIPFIHDITKFPTETQDICFAHQTFLGADYGYMRPDVGVDPNAITANLIISGHVHTRQEFGKVIYPGSAYAQSANDINQAKGLLLFDTETYAREFIECPLPQWRRVERVITPEYTIDMLHEELKILLVPQHHWVISLIGSKSEISSYIQSTRYQDIVVGIDVQLKTQFTDAVKRRVQIGVASSEQIVQEYIERIYSGSIDKELLLHNALDILKKVRSSNLSPQK